MADVSLDHLTNAELVRHVDNDANASELARELADRLDRVMRELKRIANENNLDGELYDPRPADETRST